MKKNFLSLLILVVFLGGCSTTLKMKNINSNNNNFAEMNMLVRPHQSLGLEPTQAIRDGKISVFEVAFPTILLGEYFPGRLRWNTWTVLEDGSEAFGQVIFSGIHKSGYFYGIEAIDGKMVSGQTVILSTAVDYIYSVFGKELAVEQEKFLTDPAYRKEKIQEVNKTVDGRDFLIKSFPNDRVTEDFKEIVRGMNQIQYPEGYLLSPYGAEEVGLIRGINPQYDYMEKLVGTGNFAIKLGINPIGMAICTVASGATDLIRATNAPSTGWDYNSEIATRRNMGFVIKYIAQLAEQEIKVRHRVNLDLVAKINEIKKEAPK